MKIMLLADEADPMLWEFLDKRRLEGVELILACGDLPASYLSYLCCFTAAPIVYVPGNHDVKYQTNPPEGCINADGQLIRVAGLRIVGLGGSMRYNPSRPYQYTEDEMDDRIHKLRWKLWLNKGFDILLTHAPMRGLGDLDDLPHQGFECFRPLLEKYHPVLFAFAHVHQQYNHRFIREHDYQGIRCVNGWKSCIIDLPDTLRKHGEDRF